jgi:hypothetical protein
LEHGSKPESRWKIVQRRGLASKIGRQKIGVPAILSSKALPSTNLRANLIPSAVVLDAQHSPNVPLEDEDTGVVNRLGQTQLENKGLETALQEVLNLETENVIELVLGLVEDTNPDQAANQRVTLEQTAGVLLVQGEQLTRGLTDAGQGVGDAPDFVLVAETVFTDELKLLVETLALEGTAGDLVGLRICSKRQKKKRATGSRDKTTVLMTARTCES